MNARRVIVAALACAAVALCGAWMMAPVATAPIASVQAAPAPSVVPADEAPRGMVAFVAGPACPTGWATATIAAGRLLVGTDQMTAVGRVVGEPLTAEQDRTHEHELGGATLALPHKSVSAADGGNNSGASSGAQPVTGTVAAGTSGLPFAQLTACVAP
ncbi:MAG TPA: hypothetical protein VM261_04335 [Kofleriaceae bacterium]|nr:hypothetical protein [Kofleriaceae bacterium]